MAFWASSILLTLIKGNSYAVESLDKSGLPDKSTTE